jgi:hypothetical protein
MVGLLDLDGDILVDSFFSDGGSIRTYVPMWAIYAGICLRQEYRK